jgi:hypothetical protein
LDDNARVNLEKGTMMMIRRRGTKRRKRRRRIRDKSNRRGEK